MYQLKIRYQEQDTEFKEALERVFPKHDEISHEKDFDGLTIFITVAIPIMEFSIQIVDFVFSYLAMKKTISGEKTLKRVLVTKEGDLYLEGYGKDEVNDIMRSYFDAQR